MSEKKGMNAAALSALLKSDVDNFQVAMTPGGIESQERAGQAAINHAGDLLPKRALHCTWEDVEALGVKRLGDKDDLFYIVELPEDWSMRPTEHHMWSEVVDGNGEVRLNVFYKAAFYDRHAFVSVVS